jgi:predicted RNA-binding Zn ribbon-like protein
MEVREERLFDLTLTGQLSLDLANTIDWRTSEQPRELINSYPDLLRWARHTGILTESESRRLLREVGGRPAEAAGALESALSLRETLFRIFSAIAEGQRPEPSDVEYLNAKLSEALAHLQIKPQTEGYSWHWKGSDASPGWILWPVALSAAELLTSGDLRMLRQCPGAGCAWLFVDTSRNKSRRWCAMDVCGNRAKARRHYEQVKVAH